MIKNKTNKKKGANMKKIKNLLYLVLTVPFEKIGALYKYNWFRELFFLLIVATISIWGFNLHRLYNINFIIILITGAAVFFLFYKILEK